MEKEENPRKEGAKNGRAKHEEEFILFFFFLIMFFFGGFIHSFGLYFLLFFNLSFISFLMFFCSPVFIYFILFVFNFSCQFKGGNQRKQMKPIKHPK